ncbi:MAG: hypothetical protein PHW60_03280 [Kiritimatiellae bacterium]|nr:hypothetical protein [Kiritimatiellia bacterium]
MNTDKIFGEVISRYTRSQAIEDGVLVDVTEMARQAGIKHPTAITVGVFDDYVHVPKTLAGMQDEQGRLWDILWMFVWHAKIGEINGNEGMFEVSFLTYEAKGLNETATSRNETIMLKAVCGPNDDGSPCITIMKPDED